MFTLLLALACNSTPPATPSPAPGAETPAAGDAASVAPAAEAVVGAVQEVIPAGSYTYVRVKPAAGEDVWAAVTGTGPAIGATVTVSTALPMRDFHSDTLDRTFPLVYFVQSLDGAGGATMPADHGTTAPSMGDAVTGSAVPLPAATPVTGPPAGEKKVADIWGQKAELKGREVTVTGKVTKSTHGVLGHNWLHVQDGSGAEGTNDVTITTAGDAAVGDTVVAKGVVAVDQDFGSGYTYPVMITDATITVTPAAPAK